MFSGFTRTAPRMKVLQNKLATAAALESGRNKAPIGIHVERPTPLSHNIKHEDG